MKDRIFTNNLRNLKRNFPRFLSLLVMSMLGVFVFVGLRATAPDMVQTLDQYLDNHRVYDIKIVSDLGFSQEDLDAVSEILNVAEVEGVQTLDTLAVCGQDEKVITVSTIPEQINRIDLMEGRLPRTDREIVVEKALLTQNNLEIGDILTLENDTLLQKNFEIVGVVESPLYYNSVSISQSRGNTNVGNGKVSYYTYADDSAFTSERFTACYVTVTGAAELLTSKQEYLDNVEAVTEKIRNMEKTPFFGMEPTWYLYDRTDYLTYTEYIDDAGSIDNLSKIFPLVFFLVAVLVSLISMNRMVEDDRLEIGTLKSLGFSNAAIMRKYLSFSFWATTLGAIIGAFLGCIIIPNIIFSIYQILFSISDFTVLVPWASIFLGFGITILCVCGTSVITAGKELREKPSELIRPRAPKKGRRVFLEKIPFVWKRLKFSNKITVRNIFRYKKRVLTTVFGIVGCTALILIGFGIKDSVAEIAASQYGEIFQYDGIAYLTDGEKAKEVLNHADIEDFVLAQRLDVTNQGRNANLVVFDNAEDASKMAKLTDRTTGEELHLEKGKVIISDKLADLNDLKPGDEIELTDTEHQVYRFEIQAVFENYLEHYIIAEKESFFEYEKMNPNIAYFFTGDLSKEEEEDLKEELLTSENIILVHMMNTLVESANNMLNSLNKVVWILIVLAAILAFVVLYNLANINICERKREIATLKVLGFYDKEVDQYITKETVLLTFLGILIGLVVGKYLTHVVVGTVEIERARFMNWIHVPSYVYAALFSVFFTIIVNFVTHFKLKKIDMIESLKSVE